MEPSDGLPPAFFPVGLNLVGRRCVVIGAADDKEAVEKARDLREAGAEVTCLHDPARCDEADVADAFFVISTPQDAASVGPPARAGPTGTDFCSARSINRRSDSWRCKPS